MPAKKKTARKTSATTKQERRKLVEIATGDLIPNPRNAKKHDEAQVAKIAGSIREFGFGAPIITDGRNGILAGHGRWLAAQKLGMESVPCVEMGHLTKTQQRAYVLADNRLAEIGGGWDMDQLKVELDELAAEEIDLDALGFGDMFTESEDEGGDPDSKIKEVCEVICECEDERQQHEVFEMLKGKGYRCRLATL